MNLCEGSILAQDGERLEENFVIRPRGPIRQIMHHEVRREKISPIAASTIALTAAGEIQLRGLQEFLFDVKSSVERVLRVFCNERAEKIRPHSCVQVLADLQRDFDFFGQRRRDVLGNLVLSGIETRERRKIR